MKENLRVTMTLKVLSIIAVLVISNYKLAMAQEFFGISVEYSHQSGGKIKDIRGENDNRSDFKTNSVEATAAFPIQFSDKTFLINHISGGLYYLNFSNYPGTLPDPNRIYSFSISPMLISEFRNKWNILTFFMLSNANESGRAVSGETLNYNASLIIYKEFNNGWQLGLGVMYNKEFSGYSYIPILFVGYEGDQFELNASLPLDIVLTYKVNDYFKTGIFNTVESEYCHLNDRSPYDSLTIEISSVQAGLLFNFSPLEYLHITFTTGYHYYYNLKFRNDNNRIIESDIEDMTEITVSVTLGY